MKKYLRQKYFYLYGVLILLFATPLCAQQASLQLGPNLITNPGFEEGTAGWSIKPNTAKIVSDEAHGGKKSLCYTNTDPKQYVTFTQTLQIKPGQYLHFSVWIKGKDIAGHEGAGIFVQSHDASHKYIGGAFPTTFNGTYDWKLVKGEYRVPENAADVEIGVYFRRGITGTAWFDDAEVHAELPPPLTSYLHFPNYRGMVKQGDGTPWKTFVRINTTPDQKVGEIRVQTTLMDAEGKVLLQEDAKISSRDASAEIIFHAPPNLPVGDYTLKQTFKDSDGSIATEEQFPIHVVAQMPKVYIDAQGFTVVDGKRFFPLGVFLGPMKKLSLSEDDHLQRIADGGFNTIMNYGYGRGGGKNPGEYVERAGRHHLKVLFSLKDMYPHLPGPTSNALAEAANYIQKLRGEPVLLGWYTNDEMGPEWMPELQQMYHQLIRLDPNHPTFQVLYQVNVADKYFNVTDVLGTDPYPIGKAPDLTDTSSYTRRTVAAMQNVKGVWMAPQMMSWGSYNASIKSHFPTRDELRNQAYQAIINGAKGLIFYTYNGLYLEKPAIYNTEFFDRHWPDVVAMTREIQPLIPAILNGKNIPLTIPADAKVEVGALQYQHQLLILLANPYYREEKITLPLPAGWKIKQANQGEVKSTFASGQVTFTLPSVGSGVFRLER